MLFKKRFQVKDRKTGEARQYEGKVFWYEFEFQGARIRESTGTRNRELAARIERKRRSDLELGVAGLKRINGPIKVSRAVGDFLDDNEPRWSKATFDLHTNSWDNHLKAHFGKLLLSDIQPKHISQYQRTRKKENASNRTVNMEVGLIRMVMIKHRVWHNIDLDVHMLREREDVGRALSPDEEQRILAAAKTSMSRSLFPAVQVSIHTGLRCQELRTLRWQNVDLLKEEIRVGKSKTSSGEGRVIPLSATALGCLKEWKATFPDAKANHFVFPSEKYTKNKPGGSLAVYDCDPTKPMGSWKKAWTTARRIARVSCRWHDLRHSFVSKMGDLKVSDQTLMSMTGHLSRKMLERYSHARMEAKRDAVHALDAIRPQAGKSAKSEGSPQLSPQSTVGEKEVIQ